MNFNLPTSWLFLTASPTEANVGDYIYMPLFVSVKLADKVFIGYKDGYINIGASVAGINGSEVKLFVTEYTKNSEMLSVNKLSQADYFNSSIKLQKLPQKTYIYCLSVLKNPDKY